MIEASFIYGKMYANGEISIKDAVDKIVLESGMKRGSAKNSVEIMRHILKEEVYFPTMSAKETIWKLERIKDDYGYDNLLRVIDVVEKHLNTKDAPNDDIRKYIKQIRKGSNL